MHQTVEFKPSKNTCQSNDNDIYELTSLTITLSRK